ncbi:hypothetical protein [Scytonema sp. HK-05]|uniref:hypothetical protein n=1 Tax=Scytonema sp. HK-05 TaxID=1137095 RepID=UPI000936D556|nr:hypothetical protein [Scytonema sp. HK-05]OKH58707.1 hypothetical protein NIES2130_12545 [Scytonema sp. HK-05]
MALLEGAIAACSAVPFGRSRLWADAELGSCLIFLAGGSDRLIKNLTVFVASICDSVGLHSLS